MNTLHQAAAASDAAIGVVLAFIGGLVIAGALVWMVRLGIKKRRGEPGPPCRDSRPRRPGPPDAEERRQYREPNEVPYVTDNSERLTPHELGSGSPGIGWCQVPPEPPLPNEPPDPLFQRGRLPLSPSALRLAEQPGPSAGGPPSWRDAAPAPGLGAGAAFRRSAS